MSETKKIIRVGIVLIFAAALGAFIEFVIDPNPIPKETKKTECTDYGQSHLDCAY